MCAWDPNTPPPPPPKGERTHVSLGLVDRRVSYFFFVWDVVNGFIFVVLASGGSSQLGAIIHPDNACECSCGPSSTPIGAGTLAHATATRAADTPHPAAA